MTEYPRLVIDANIIISALIRDSISRKLIIEAPVFLFSPSMVHNEVIDHIDNICSKNSLTKKENIEILEHIFSYIQLVETDMYYPYLKKSHEIMKNIDVNDTPYLALALSIHADGIWSEDTDFEKQKIIPVWKTKDTMKKLK